MRAEMEPKNYRIGSLVKYDNRVFSIHSLSEELPTLDTTEFGIGVVDWNNLKPINIDRFWLEALGFTWSSMRKGWRISKSGIEILFDKDFGCYIEMVGIDIDYVHELQNLFFAIHKEELELKKIK